MCQAGGDDTCVLQQRAASFTQRYVDSLLHSPATRIRNQLLPSDAHHRLPLSQARTTL